MGEQMNPQDIAALKNEILSSLHCALPGIVESFDAETQTATIRPAVKHTMSFRPSSSGVIPSEAEGSPRRSDVFLPLLCDVPVFMPVPFPVSPGDPCLLVFADCDIDAWLESGQAEEPVSGRMHSLSDAFAFVGFTRRSG